MNMLVRRLSKSIAEPTANTMRAIMTSTKVKARALLRPAGEGGKGFI
jgi:hypothetical protein